MKWPMAKTISTSRKSVKNTNHDTSCGGKVQFSDQVVTSHGLGPSEVSTIFFCWFPTDGLFEVAGIHPTHMLSDLFAVCSPTTCFEVSENHGFLRFLGPLVWCLFIYIYILSEAQNICNPSGPKVPHLQAHCC